MKLQRLPLILLAIAFLLGGIVYFSGLQPSPTGDTAQTNTEPLFGFKEAAVQTLTLTTQGQTLSFVKTPIGRVAAQTGQTKAESAKTDHPVWLMTAPAQAPANDAAVAYLLNLMANGTRQHSLPIAATKQAEFGFDKPLAIATIKLSNHQTHQLILGKPNFNHSALYAQVDPPDIATADRAIVLVSKDFENAVTRALPDWQSKTP